VAFVCDGKQRLDGKLVLKAEEDRADAISQWALALAAAIDQLRPSEQGVEVERRISNERRLACASQSVSRSLSGLRVTSCRQSRVSAGERRASITERERAAALGKQLSFSEASSKDLAGWRKFSATSCGNLGRAGGGPGGEWQSISMNVDGLLPARDRAALHDLGVAAHWKATMRQSRRPNWLNVHPLDVLSVSILVSVQAGLVCILALW